MLMAPETHYLLFAEASFDAAERGTWRFMLEQVSTGEMLSACDAESSDCSERLELLAVVRGLEALDQPARVTLVTKSRYVGRGLKHGLAEWRNNDWHWERFGRLAPVRDHDLWKRVDRALRFHQVECRLWRFDDEPTATPLTVAPTVAAAPARAGNRLVAAARTSLERATRAAASFGESLRTPGLAAS